MALKKLSKNYSGKIILKEGDISKNKGILKNILKEER